MRRNLPIVEIRVTTYEVDEDGRIHRREQTYKCSNVHVAMSGDAHPIWSEGSIVDFVPRQALLNISGLRLCLAFIGLLSPLQRIGRC